MAESSLVGIFEIAEMADVSPSAVANWRKRFTDFPTPLANLKSGPVFGEAQIKMWLAKRAAHTGEAPQTGLFYDRLASKRGDSPELRKKVEKVVDHLHKQVTSNNRPGVLLGKIQSGKTRAFLGVMARAFDRGYDVTVIITKGTRSLSEQTLSRVKEDFRDFIDEDQIEVFDVRKSVPELTPYELDHKLVFVAMKEHNTMSTLLTLFQQQYPQLRKKSVLLIDDEADLASISFRKVSGNNTVGTISQQIDQLRDLVGKLAFLQVTATPYSLYLQPDEDEVTVRDDLIFKPKRPAFTVLLPTHEKYVGGDEYFEKSTDPESPAFYFHHEVPVPEREALKKEDRRRLQIDRVLTEKNVSVLREAIMTFLVGGTIRRIQQQARDKRQEKYSFLFHTEAGTDSHEWQEAIAKAIYNALVDQAREDSPLFNTILRASYADLERSVELAKTFLPDFEKVKQHVIEVLGSGQLMITAVNHKKKEIPLDDTGQLKLRTPFNMFIGGQILDRGVTIHNLIAFYYGRNPKNTQQDTVLQHSRMYGTRSKEDLAVTRFYSPQHVYQIMKKIHEFDGALREAFESGAHDKGVYFIQKDASNRLKPCSPNKLLFSDIVSIRPGKRLVMSGFTTVAKSAGSKNLTLLDNEIDNLVPESEEPVLIDVADAIKLLELAYSNLKFDNPGDNDQLAHIAALRHLSLICNKNSLKGKAYLITAKDRDIARYREEGRFSNAPDTKQQKDKALHTAQDIPCLMLLRQNGTEEKGWRGLPFWWPVIVIPKSVPTVIFSKEEAVPSTATVGDLINGAVG